ncbi:MAG: Glu-tRNA(Gln) amidotransferase subunit GatE, partial [Candidatus Micrarchaeota archaeon]|nr:Glu-tRNA(Gln) amidotransferase subunit GatE [Candidatus Micrarchaeota archaeon]
PRAVSAEAIHAALSVCELLGSKTVDELHTMRKTVIDGSNTSGFQRTALVGLGGKIKITSGDLEIQSICLEEESAGILEGGDKKAAYSLDRLGIPLIEIATSPGITSGKEAQEAALAIGTALRRTGMVQRGIGTIRQDLNISIEGGARVEIKGVQELSTIAKTVELEVLRQQNLIKLFTEAKATTSSKPVEEKFVNLTELFSSTRSPMISKMLKSGNQVFGLALPGFAGFLGREINPNRRFGSELADYARSSGVNGLIHSDEQMEKYNISDDELSEVKVALGLGAKDAFAIVISDEKKATAALSEVAKRASFFGVAEETRRANPDGTSSYMRPLPGRARMYPETDVPIMPITSAMRASAKKSVKEMAEAEGKKQDALSTINNELRMQLSNAKNLLSASTSGASQAAPSMKTPEISAFTRAIEIGIDPKFAASALTNVLPGLKREGVLTQNLNEERFVSALVSYREGAFAKAALPDILREMCSNQNTTPAASAEKLGLSKITGKALEKLIKTEKLDLAGLMAKYRLRVDASEAQQIIGKKQHAP